MLMLGVYTQISYANRNEQYKYFIPILEVNLSVSVVVQ